MQLILAFDNKLGQQGQPPVRAWCLMEERAVVQVGGPTTLADLFTTVQGYTFTTHVMLMNPDTSVLQINKPAGSFRKIRQALPYLLEDQLADEVEDLHFAILEQPNNKIVIVGIIAKTILQTCIDELSVAGFFPQSILPVWLALPFAKDTHQLLALMDTDYIWVRAGEFSGLTLDRYDMEIMWPLVLNKQKPSEIKWVTSTVVDPIWLAECETQNIPATVLTLTAPETWITYVAKHYTPEPGINFLQGEFSAQQKNQTEKHWRKLAKQLAVAVVGVWLFGMIGQNLFLRWEHFRYQQQINDVYEEVFPNQPIPSQVRTIFERELNKVASGLVGTDFLSLMLRVGETLANYPQIEVKGVSYDHQQLTLTINADSFTRIQQLDKALRDKGLTVEQENATSTGGVVQARWRIG